MTDVVIVAMCATVAPTIASVAALVVALKTKDEMKLQGENIQKIEVATNSMKDALVEATARASKSEGKEEERVEARERNAQKEDFHR